MATETALTRVNVFPSESSYNQNKSSVANTELSLIKVSSNFLEGSVSSVQEPQVTDGRSTDNRGYGKMWTWYRVYDSGWVEQGGHFERASGNGDDTQTVTLPIPMKDVHYSILISKEFASVGGGSENDVLNVGEKTTSNFKYWAAWRDNSSNSNYMPCTWYVCGYKA